MGGAHGNYNTRFLSFDLIANKEITLQDILNKAGIKKLNPLLEKYFRKKMKLSNTDPLTDAGLFENKISPNENFYATTKGLGFSYSPYEIAAYAMGEISIFIPFHELNNYLQPGFRKLIR